MGLRRISKEVANRHPSKTADEVFVGNHSFEDFKRLRWATKRVSADIPYEANGHPSDRHVSPVYVKSWEIKEDPLLTPEEKRAYLNS